MLDRQVQELDQIAVFENRRRLRPTFSQHWCEIWPGERDPLVERPIELALQFPQRPLFDDRSLQVELTLFVPLTPTQDRQMVAPRQFSQRRCEF